MCSVKPQADTFHLNILHGSFEMQEGHEMWTDTAVYNQTAVFGKMLDGSLGLFPSNFTGENLQYLL